MEYIHRMVCNRKKELRTKSQIIWFLTPAIEAFFTFFNNLSLEEQPSS